MYRNIFKRVFDLFVSLVFLPLWFPILVIFYALGVICIGSPVFFKQKRIGLDNRVFFIYKFRSMTNKRDANGQLLPDLDRLTTYGLFLRKSSIDELPSILNVLLGDLSLVGPRPLLMEYLPYYTERESIRHKVTPGLTGLAQVNGRNFLLWDERLALDVVYVENLTFYLDLKILMRTVIQVIIRKDVATNPASLGGRLDEIRKKK